MTESAVWGIHFEDQAKELKADSLRFNEFQSRKSDDPSARSFGRDFHENFSIKLLTESSTFECSEFAKCHLSARELFVLNSVLNSEFLIGKFSFVSLKDHLRL